MRWRGFGFVHHSRTLFCRAVPNPILTIRNFSIAVQRTVLVVCGCRRNPVRRLRVALCSGEALAAAARLADLRAALQRQRRRHAAQRRRRSVRRQHHPRLLLLHPPPRSPPQQLLRITREALQQQSQTHRRKPQGRNKTQCVETSLLTLQNPHTHTNTYARTLRNQHGSHRQCRRNDATELAHADMTTLPKVDTICTA
jgi:hypothetical protein